MQIIEYENKYASDVKNLLEELQDYIVSIDPYGYNVKKDGYKEQVFKIDIDEVKNNNGKIYLAINNEKVIGLIIGVIRKPVIEYNFENPNNMGEVVELIVAKNIRSKGAGHNLLQRMEEYFKEQNCKTINIDVFGYNEIGKNFYFKNGYHTRMMTVSKAIDK